ncbi:MAG: L-threonylcarbamoyladenylate synthase [Chlamydiota bacterium]
MLVSFEEALRLLQQEDVVALPTETVYGLAVKYDSQKGIEKLYTMKGRPEQKPLTVNLYKAQDLKKFLKTSPPGLEKLVKHFWPGPLTIVLEVKEDLILPIVRSGGSTCGFRIPDHTLTRQLIEVLGPVVLPSANLSGMPAAINREQIEKDFGEKIPVLDGRDCRIGIASTVIVFDKGKWKILREGAISQEELDLILKN